MHAGKPVKLLGSGGLSLENQSIEAPIKRPDKKIKRSITSGLGCRQGLCPIKPPSTSTGVHDYIKGPPSLSLIFHTFHGNYSACFGMRSSALPSTKATSRKMTTLYALTTHFSPLNTQSSKRGETSNLCCNLLSLMMSNTFYAC